RQGRRGAQHDRVETAHRGLHDRLPRRMSGRHTSWPVPPTARSQSRASRTVAKATTIRAAPDSSGLRATYAVCIRAACQGQRKEILKGLDLENDFDRLAGT